MIFSVNKNVLKEKPEPIVSIICATYNHEKYISKAIEGFLMQETSFPFEIFVHDDASTDRTREIIETYHLEYPDIIKPIFQKNNQHSFGRKIIPIVLPYCKGKYVALCEGDDYWSDPYKLQKQVDFFEFEDSEKKFSLSFHDSQIIDENGEILFESLLNDYRGDYTNEDVILGKTIPTQTILFRRECLNIEALKLKSNSGDTLLFTLLTQKGKAKNLSNIKKAKYRKHGGGVWSTLNIKAKYINSLNYHKEVYSLFDKHTRSLILTRIFAISQEINFTNIDYFKRTFIKLKCLQFLISRGEYGKSLLIIKQIIFFK